MFFFNFFFRRNLGNAVFNFGDGYLNVFRMRSKCEKISRRVQL